jgi:hypothetical protein
MEDDQDPRQLFNQLASIHSSYNTTTRKIDDDQIAVVLEKAPDKYKSILTAEQRNKGTLQIDHTAVQSRQSEGCPLASLFSSENGLILIWCLFQYHRN